MVRLFIYLGILFSAFLTLLQTVSTHTVAPTVFSTSTVVATTTTATTTPTGSASATLVATSTAPATSTQAKVIQKTAVNESQPRSAAPAETQVAPEITYAQADLDAAAVKLRAALVNIVCVANAGSGLQSISGSGVFIDSKGIILTNSHVAQYFLFKDKGVSCSIRTGSPAQTAYTAAPIFISPAWVSANATLLAQAVASGTGEHDLALLGVTGSTNSTPLPHTFPAVTLATIPPSAYEPVVIGSYAAQFLNTQEIASALFPTMVFGSVKELFTFDVNTADIFSLGGSVAAQEGSSGGGVLDPSAELVGTITTSTVEGDTSTRNMNAITASYIRADYASETGVALDTVLSKPVATSIANFAPEMPGLEAEIVSHLKSN